MHFLAREKEEGRRGGAHWGGARRPCDSLVATEVAEVEEDIGDPRKKRWRGGGGVERRRALVPRLAGPVLKQILPAALPVASHGGARGLGRRGRGWAGAVKAREGWIGSGRRWGAGQGLTGGRDGDGGAGAAAAWVGAARGWIWWRGPERGSKGIWREGGRIARGVLMAHRPLGAPLEFCFNLAH